MQPTPQSERLHLALYGRCNSGKSSLLNVLVGQHVAITSSEAGTTTDTVRKAMEMPGLGAVVWMDTPGLDDQTRLKEERLAQSRQALEQTDLALLLFTDEEPSVEMALLAELRRREIPVVGVIAQSDRLPDPEGLAARIEAQTGLKPVITSAQTGRGVEKLRERLAALQAPQERLLTEGFCERGNRVLLVMPQDQSAPKGRLIQPQVQTLRELLDRGCLPLCCTPEGMESALASWKEPPHLIITDSQAFEAVYTLKPAESLLTSFSILFARYKGDIDLFVAGARRLQTLPPTARILIAEACAHAPQQEDIGRVKLPRLLRKRLGEGLQIEVVGGRDFPEDLTPYDLVIHCGACLFNRRLVMSRVARARKQEVPMTNYGVAIAALTGILDRVAW